MTDSYGDGTTLLGDFARGFRRLEQRRLETLKPYVYEPVYGDKHDPLSKRALEIPEAPVPC